MISTSIGNKNFIEVKKISPFVSKVIIKVLYIGMSSNRSLITREFADKLAESLPGSAIVGKYDYFDQDFLEHEERISIKEGKPVYSFDTRPYGFVDINTKIWYEDFVNEDDNGNKETRTYLCVEGYLWTGIYPDCKRVLEGKNGVSMQIDRQTYKGEWTEDSNKKLRYFIFNDGNISSLCILGEKIKAGFAGANIKPATNFSMNEEEKEIILNFSLALMRELKGEIMEENINESQVIEQSIEQSIDQSIEQPIEQVVDQPVEQPIEQSIEDVEKNETEEQSTTDKENEVSVEEVQEEGSDSAEEQEREVSVEEQGEISQRMSEYQGNADLQACIDKLTGVAESLTASVQAILDGRKETEQQTEVIKNDESKEKEECILNFSKLSLDKMKEVLGNNTQQDNKENHEEMNNTPITSFSAVNQMIIETEQKKELPEFMKYVKELEKNQ